MSDFLLDSSAIIWLLRGRPDTVALVERLGREGFAHCSALSVFEVKAGMRPGEEGRTEMLLDAFRVLPVDSAAANRAASWFRDSRGGGRTPDPVDALIAATAAIHGLKLLTYNPRDFTLPGVELIPI